MIAKGRKTKYQLLIEELLNSTNPRIRMQFMDMVNSMKDEANIKQLAELLQSGKIDEAVNMLNAHVDRFADEVIMLMPTAATQAATFLRNTLSINVSYNQTNYRAVNLMNSSRIDLVRELRNEQRASVRVALSDGIARGLNPRDQARNFRDSIGLTARQQQAVINYRTLLENNSSAALTRQLRDRRFDGTVARAIEENSLLTTDQINRIVDRYRTRFINFRAENIARTESLRTIHESTNEMFSQAIETGALQKDELVQEWLTAGDGDVRDSHESMHGQQVAFGEKFTSGSGNAIAYPGDRSAPAEESINCRCTVTTRIRGK